MRKGPLRPLCFGDESMFLLITFNCLVMAHECSVHRQVMPDKESCIKAAEIKQERLDAAGMSRFVVICREITP